MKIKIVLASAAFLIMHSLAFAKDIYIPRIYNGEEYQFNAPLSITQDKQGNIFINNTYGWWNQSTITQIPYNNSNNPIIFNNKNYHIIKKIISDNYGNIWALSCPDNYCSRTNLIKIPTDRTQNPIIFPEEKYYLSGACVGSCPMTSDPKGNIWIANTFSGIIIKIPASNPNQPILYNTAQDRKYKLFNPNSIAADQKGNIWIGNENINSITEIPVNQPDKPIIYSGEKYHFNVPENLLIDIKGNVWVHNSGDGSITKLPADNFKNPIVFSGPIYNHTHAFYMVSDPQGNIWLADYLQNQIIEIKLEEPNNPLIFSGENYHFNTVNLIGSGTEILADVEGNIWIPDYKNNSVTELVKTQK